MRMRRTVPAAAAVLRLLAVRDGVAQEWASAGEVAVALIGGRRPSSDLAPHVKRLPGPGLVVAVRFQASPIGPFTELSVMEPVRRGVHVGMSITRSVVDDDRARRDGFGHWGLPPELGALRWTHDGEAVEVRWDEEGLDLRVEPTRRPVPVVVPMRLLQARNSDPVIGPARIRGLMRVGRAEIGAPAEGAFGMWAGAHRGALIAAQRIRMGPTMRPLDWGRWRVSDRPSLA